MKVLTLLVILVDFLINLTSAVMVTLNETEHARMPPLYHMDDYTACAQKQFLFCNVDLQIVPDADSELYNLILEYSLHERTHFDHRQLHYNICVNETCPNATEGDLGETLEACLSESLWKTYGLRAKITNEIVCETQNEIQHNIDNLDIFVAGMFIVLLVLNIVGSLSWIMRDKSDKKGNTFLNIFSIQNNWDLLFTLPDEIKQPNHARLKGLDGFRAITAVCVIVAHVFISFVIDVENSLELEKLHEYPLFQTGLNATVLVQTFFIISGMLLIYTGESSRSDMQLSDQLITLLKRYLRLTLPYVVVLAFLMTWFRFLGSGPQWQLIVTSEVEACRSEWLANLLYYNNFLSESHCLPQSWYLSSDMQLYVVGIALMVYFRRPAARNAALAALFLMSLLAPALHTYFQDLDAVLIVSPETIRNIFVTNPTFTFVYTRSYTNMSCFVMGLALAYLVLHLQKTDFQFHQSFRYLYWLSVPAAFAVMLAGRWFYVVEERPPAILRAVYAALFKPIYGIFIVILILGTIFKADGLYRGVLEWHVWTYIGRLSYLTYLTHSLIIRYYVGSRITQEFVSIWNIVNLSAHMVVASFILAVPLYVMIESPLCQLVKVYVTWKPKRTKTKENHQDPSAPFDRPPAESTDKTVNGETLIDRSQSKQDNINKSQNQHNIGNSIDELVNKNLDTLDNLLCKERDYPRIRLRRQINLS